MSIPRHRGALISAVILAVTTSTSLAAALALPVLASLPISARHLPVRSPGQLPVPMAAKGRDSQGQPTDQSQKPTDQASRKRQ